ncbi:ATPase [Saccharobesus litoralis]|uniref:ATPase n=1 Tax=Saccharobesus litoralis TaxID=2172099 RepID=A0A2S0VW90_9ALTE|nr:ATPase [Saccharobesus litoralis]AWB68455.1 ATPase [Saccharobesus litoralis]
MTTNQTNNKMYGLTRLALLNTAGYAKCIIPLDDSASICAPNNTGKSSVINALQFPLINDLRMTEWDGHDLDETKRFYFASDQSYILLEAELADGPVVIGVAGRGKVAGYAYQFFTYRGQLKLDDYLINNKIVKYTSLPRHLVDKGYHPIELKANELNALLTGGATQFDMDIALKMIPLNNASDAPIYKEIFRKILNLHKLSSQDVKRFILRVFERHMSNAKVDFFDVWNQAFEKVNRARKELRALEKQQEAIAALENMLDNRSVLRGKINAYQPKLETALVEWDDYYTHSCEAISLELTDILEEHNSHTDKRHLFEGQLRDIATQKAELTNWFNNYNRFEQDFSLTNQATLEQNLAQVKNQYESLTHTLKGAEGKDLESIQRRRSFAERDLRRLKLQYQNLEFNLYAHLCEELSLNEVKELSRLLNPDLLSLSTTKNGDIEITDENAFADHIDNIASTIKGGKLHLNGATIDLKNLEPASVPDGEGKNQIKAQLEDLKLLLEELGELEQVAEDITGKQQEQAELYKQVVAAEQDLKLFARYQSMCEQFAEKQSLRDTLELEDDALQEKLDGLQARGQSLSDKRTTLNAQLEQLKRRAERLQKIKEERQDHQLDLFSGRATPYPLEVVIDLDNLEDELDSYNKTVVELNAIEMNIKNTYLVITKAGITKFEIEEDEEVRYSKLISAFHHIDDEREAIERQARVALTEVAATIKGLRQDLDRLKREMLSFNNSIWRKPISNLKSFTIEVVERDMLVKHIDTIISTSSAYDIGESFDLLSSEPQPKNDAEVNLAKDYLVKIASERGGLSLSDLFDIRFKVINREDKAEYYDKIDSAGSNGTRITIKLLCGMMFIRHLLVEKERGLYRIPIYIDEAADIDPSNQSALIETALEFGFVPIFASVKPQTTCKYIVPIRTTSDGATNWVDEKDWLRIERA